MFHRGPSELNRFQIRHRRDCPRPAHLVLHGFQHGARLFRFKLVSQCPSRTFGRHAQSPLLIVAVDLDDQTIDGKVQIVPRVLPMGHGIHDSLDALNHFKPAALGRFEPPFSGGLHSFAVGQNAHLRHGFGIDIVHHAVQRPCGHHGAVLKFQCPRSRVPGVRKLGFSRLASRLIQRLEPRPWEKDLPTDFQRIGGAFVQFQGKGFDGGHIGANVFTCGAVAPCQCLDKGAILIPHADGHPVVLELNHKFHLLASQPRLDALGPLTHFFCIVAVRQRQHGRLVRHFFKLVGQISSHPHRRGSGVVEFRMCTLQLGQF